VSALAANSKSGRIPDPWADSIDRSVSIFYACLRSGVWLDLNLDYLRMLRGLLLLSNVTNLSCSSVRSVPRSSPKPDSIPPTPKADVGDFEVSLKSASPSCTFSLASSYMPEESYRDYPLSAASDYRSVFVASTVDSTPPLSSAAYPPALPSSSMMAALPLEGSVLGSATSSMSA
jgi:hypothetical protein